MTDNTKSSHRHCSYQVSKTSFLLMLNIGHGFFPITLTSWLSYIRNKSKDESKTSLKFNVSLLIYIIILLYLHISENCSNMMQNFFIQHSVLLLFDTWNYFNRYIIKGMITYWQQWASIPLSQEPGFFHSVRNICIYHYLLV